MFNVFRQTLVDWKVKYEVEGKTSLEESTSCRRYPKELKLAAIQDYLSGYYSLREIITKYCISSTSVFRKWLKKYNDHRDIKDTGKGISNSMTNGRKTSLEERVQVVKYCLSHQKNYHHTAETFDVSYQQVYQWVKNMK